MIVNAPDRVTTDDQDDSTGARIVGSIGHVTQVVTDEWRAALQVQTAAPDDDFFVLGGNSLLAVTLIERVEHRLGIVFPVEALFVEGTLGAVTEACAAATEAGAVAPLDQPVP